MSNYYKSLHAYIDAIDATIKDVQSRGDEYQELTPWYATMYVKKEYRKKGYSKILNDAILKEAKSRGFKKIRVIYEILGKDLEFCVRVIHIKFL